MSWSRTRTSLALCQRYAALSPQQQVLHDCEAIAAPRDLQQLMPAATRARLADPAFVAAAAGLYRELTGANDEMLRREAWRLNAPARAAATELAEVLAPRHGAQGDPATGADIPPLETPSSDLPCEELP